MRKPVIAAMLASLVSAPVFAQSALTIYGILDIGLNHTSNKEGESLNELRSGNTYTSRLGFRGREDLGGGMGAIFNLETGLNLDNGTSSSAAVFWNRQSWVGLAMDGIGQVTAGLQLPTISDVFVASSHATYLGNQGAALDGAGTAPGSAAFRYNNMIGGTRVVNAIKLTSATLAGFRVGAMTALDENSNLLGRMDSIGMTYGRGPFEAGAAYHRTSCPNGGCAAERGTDEISGIGGAWKFQDRGRIGAFYTYQNNARTVRGNDAGMLSVLAVVPLNQWTFLAGYQSLNDLSDLHQDIKQLNLGVKYLLSKRTELYSLYSAQRVDNGGKAGMYAELSSDDKQSQFNIGLRHSF